MIGAFSRFTTQEGYRMARKSRKDAGHEAPVAGARDSQAEEAQNAKWVVVVLGAAKKEGHKILNDVRYDHVVSILKRLVDFGNLDELSDLDIEPIESFYELKEKGGILGKINLRIYFGTFPDERELVIVKTYKKEEENAVPRHVIVLVENRLEAYDNGRLREAATVFQERASKE